MIWFAVSSWSLSWVFYKIFDQFLESFGVWEYWRKSDCHTCFWFLHCFLSFYDSPFFVLMVALGGDCFVRLLLNTRTERNSLFHCEASTAIKFVIGGSQTDADLNFCILSVGLSVGDKF